MRRVAQTLAAVSSTDMTTEHDDHAGHDHGADGGHEAHGHHEHSYQAAIGGYRAEKDEFFKTSPHSPIPAEERDAFEGLPYYPLDVDLVVEGLALQPYTGDEPTTFQIPTSDGKLRPARRAGTFTFDLDGAERRLTAYSFESGETRSLFVPFLDETSGKETYGAGRYLDLEPDEDGTYAWQDETGYQYYGTSDELDAWAAEAGYVDVPPAPHTPDTDNGYGLRERDLWSDDQTERARFREAAFKRMLDERTNG